MTLAALASIALPSSMRISVLASTMAAIVWVTCVLVVRGGFAMGRAVQTPAEVPIGKSPYRQ
jgi:hypothetical protein